MTKKQRRTPRELSHEGLHEALSILTGLPQSEATGLARPVDLAAHLGVARQRVSDALAGRVGVAKVAYDYAPAVKSERGRLIGVVDGDAVIWLPLKGQEPIEKVMEDLLLKEDS